ncbi:metallopeptidase TldD-related protein [Clostridium sporogenes]|uniref:metallopeptidase TldD-related protein n=1 Tax=Clostridium sporogenes TaxID=1509 RepID=UPI0006B2640F|nr:metallopeptidase TldD-related protein [Clostridium sporogenes]KOY65409.1 hypothetical protein AN649_13085 [Clostridium sporogenes]MDS1006662.1 metallopeptidase TldD-related protein [Clostridium sporogenes]
MGINRNGINHTMNQISKQIEVTAFNGEIVQSNHGIWGGERISYKDGSFTHNGISNKSSLFKSFSQSKLDLFNYNTEYLIKAMKRLSENNMQIDYKQAVTSYIVDGKECGENDFNTLECTLYEGNDKVTISTYKKNDMFKDEDIIILKNTLKERIKDIQQATNPIKKNMPILLDEEAAGLLTAMIVGYLLEGDRISAGTSYLFNHMERFKINPLLKISDIISPSLPVFFTRDEEGTTAINEIPLIKDGRLCSYITDVKSAEFFGVKNNGRSRSQDYRHIPLPRICNVITHDGDQSFNQLLSNINNGYYCVGVSGAAVDVASGVIHVNFQVSYNIENGEITNSINNFSLSINIYEYLQYVRLIGNRKKEYYRFMGKSRPLQNHLVGFSSPHIVLEGCCVE